MPNNQNELKDSIKSFVDTNYSEKTYALLYASNKCFLGKVDKTYEINVNGDKSFDINKVFEARIFNANAELRWLKGFGEKVITDKTYENCSDKNYTFVGKTEKLNYLLWGKKLGEPENDWTQFGTARIGTFEVPEIINTEYARFEAVEYLMSENENGNVFVADERLTGITPYISETKGGKEDA